MRKMFNAKYLKRNPGSPGNTGNNPSKLLQKAPWSPKKQQIETEYTFGPLAPPLEKRTPTELFGPDPTTGED